MVGMGVGRVGVVVAMVMTMGMIMVVAVVMVVGLAAEDLGRVDGEHGDAVPGVVEQAAEPVDERALADARHAADADADRGA